MDMLLFNIGLDMNINVCKAKSKLRIIVGIIIKTVSIIISIMKASVGNRLLTQSERNFADPFVLL